MRIARLALLAAASCCCSVPVALAQGVEVCTDEQVAEWTHLREDSVGVHLRDPSLYLMPGALPPAPDEVPERSCPGVVELSLNQSGRADDGIHQWIYALSCKRIVCGQPLSFESNRGASFLSGEFDLNNNLLVPPKLKAELRRYECFHEGRTRDLAPQYPHLCFPQTDAIHAEISPPSGMRKALGDLWLVEFPDRWQAWRDRLAEGFVCLEGPVVGDTGHALKLEVHPAQFIWWNENTRRDPRTDPFKEDGPFVLLAIQDASARYSRKHHFVLSDPLPPKGVWRPWAAGPIEATFEIPVAATPKETLHLTIEREQLDRPLRPSDRPLPAVVSYLEARDSKEEGRFRAIVSNAAPPQSVQAEVRVLCRKDPGKSTDRYLSKLVVHLTTGSDIDWHEGFLALRVTDRRLPRSPSLAVQGEDTLPQRRPPAVLSLLSWKPTDGTRWISVPAVSLDDAKTAHQLTRKLFEAAGWTSQHPYPGLRRLTQIDVQVERSLQGPDEHEARSRAMRPLLDWPTQPVLQPPSEEVSCGTLEPPTRVQNGLRIRLPDTPLAPCRLDVTPRVRPSRAFIEWAKRKSLAAPTELTQTWSIWTHGFVAGREDQWMAAIESFWSAEMQRCEKDGYIMTKDRPSCATKEELDRSLPKEEVRILLPPILRDGIVSVDEVAGLADNLRELADRRCRDQCPKRPPSTWVEAR